MAANDTTAVTVQMAKTLTINVTKVGSKKVTGSITLNTDCSDLREAVAQLLIERGMDGDLSKSTVTVDGQKAEVGKPSTVKEGSKVVVTKPMKGGK